jgi:regulator of sirC expression with transglutaminase-like and TPR domain
VSDDSLRSLLRFAAFVRQPGHLMDLAQGALLIADLGYPALDHRPTLRRLDALAADVRAELGMPPGSRLPAHSVDLRATAERTLAALRTVLAAREGFTGHRDDYYAPENSFLNRVLERKRGLPITLSVLYMEVARRIGAPLVGVGLPAHFIAKWPLSPDEGDDLFVDAFAGGELLDLDACRLFMMRLTAGAPGGPRFEAEWIDPVGPRQILARMLGNLKQIYLQIGETALALEVVERLALLRPDSPEELRDRGLLRLAMGEILLAAADLFTFVERAPQFPEAPRVRRRLQSIAEVHNKLN